MARYIDADKLIAEYDRVHIGEPGGARKLMVDAPTEDVVEVVHAYWKETTHITVSKRTREIHSKLYNCSNCDAPNGRKKSSYCHWCGAKMDGTPQKQGERE